MIISSVKLYKTPLDSAYNNVFDNYSTYAEYTEFLIANYPHLEIDLNSAKSIRSNDEFSEIVLPYYQNSVRDYNYLQITNNDGDFFYFVIGTTSLDDGNTPSTRFNLKWDSWANNYLNIRNLNGIIERKTPISVKSRNYMETEGGPRVDAIPNNVPIDISNVPVDVVSQGCISEQLVTYSEIPNSVILWLACRLQQPAYYKDGDATGIVRGCYTQYGQTPIVYYPIGCVDVRTRKLIRDYDRIKLSLSSEFTTLFNGMVQVDLRNIYNEGTPAVLDARLSFLPPFDYSISLEVDGNIETIVVGAIAEQTPVYLDFECTKPFSPTATADTAPHFVTARPRSFDGVRYQFDAYELSALLNNKYQLFSSTDTNFNMLCDGVINAFPFKYYQLFINGKIIPLPIVYDNDKIYVELDNYSTPSAKFRVINKLGDNKTYINIDNSACVITRSDQYDAYLASNGNRLALEYIKNVTDIGVKTGSIIASQGLTAPVALPSIINSSFSIANKLAMQKDLENAPDIINSPSLDAMCDTHYHDDIIYQFVEINNKFLYENFYKNAHYYGIEYHTVGNLASIDHYTFDFTKGEPICENIKNIADKIAIKAAFMNGVTRWHIDANNDYNNLITFNKDTINLERGDWENQ